MSTPIARRRRSTRSTMAPAGIPKMSHGSSWRKTAAATVIGSRVSGRHEERPGGAQHAVPEVASSRMPPGASGSRVRAPQARVVRAIDGDPTIGVDARGSSVGEWSLTARRRPAPRPAAVLVERGEALARLGADALAGDEPGRVPLRRAVRQAADLADHRLGGAGGGRTRGQDVADGGVDGRIERGVAFDDLVDEPDALGAHGVEPPAAGEERPGVASRRSWRPRTARSPPAGCRAASR